MVSQVESYYEQIKEKFDKTETVTLNIEVDEQIQKVLAQTSDFARLICKKKRESFYISREEKPLKDFQVEMGGVVKIKGSDNLRPYYTGSTYLQGDSVMLAEFNNKRVVLLNSSYQYIASFTLADKPWDICAVDQHEVAVCLPFQKTLQFLSVTNGSIKATKKFQTKYACRGIASAGNGKIVASGHCNDKGKHYWSLITSTGKEEICHQFDCQCRPSTTYINVNSSCTSVYLSVFLANSLYCFDMDGKSRYIYSIDSLKGPKGVATDKDGNVYVVGWSSHNIHQLTSDGAPIRIVSDGISRGPLSICFNKSLDRFLMTNDTASDSINLYVFRMKQ
ncbi:hypothetical protein ACJMK2_014464 [Sinanodonta woodiana]|uniref:Uncharacterized protein n=1 Tax=Sinanodonta woodiana TaxID=1069815 RepID=A0ABD3V385_SINWO